MALEASGESIKQAVEAAERLVKLLTFPAKAVGKFAYDELVTRFKIGFSEFLTASYNKCCFYKTVLSKSSIDLYSNYTNLNLYAGGSIVSDFDLIEEIIGGGDFVVTGTAGAGKSMLLKYITISLFRGDYSTFPIFLELRKVNDHSGDLLSFVKQQCLPDDSFITMDQFKKSLKGGNFLLLLDGYDEINSEIKPKIEEGILSLRRNFPKLTVVISSRVDDRFRSWPNFREYRVDLLNKKQCLDVVSKLLVDNDDGARDRFYKQVDEYLYASHTTFLSTPLLITIMLFTYERSGVVPEQMHEFYSRAYDALFERHDVTKEQFVRKKFTGLDKGQFATCFSAFCALSYQQQNYEFDENSLNLYCERAIKYCESRKISSPSLSVKSLVKDLIESVCLLQVDGAYWVFAHRSFQEYFCAIFVSQLPDDYCRKFCDEIVFRYQDSVMRLFHGIDRDKFQRVWASPVSTKILHKLESDIPVYEKISTYTSQIYIEVESASGVRDISIAAMQDDENYDSISIDLLLDVFECETSGLYDSLSDRYISRSAKDMLIDKWVGAGANKMASSIENFPNLKYNSNLTLSVNKKNESTLIELGSELVLRDVTKALRYIVNRISSEENERRTFLDNIL